MTKKLSSAARRIILLIPLIRGQKTLRAQQEEPFADNITPQQFINNKKNKNHRIKQIKRITFGKAQTKNPLNPLNPMTKKLSSAARRTLR